MYHSIARHSKPTYHKAEMPRGGKKVLVTKPYKMKPKPTTTMAFLHVSTGKVPKFSAAMFKEPIMRRPFMRHSLNPPDGSLFLSRLNADGGSDWMRYATSGEEDSTEWCTGTRHVFHVDFESMGIYVVNTVDDMKAFFKKYGVPSTPWRGWHAREMDKMYTQLSTVVDWLDTYMTRKGLTDETLMETIAGIEPKGHLPWITAAGGVDIPKSPKVTAKFLAVIVAWIRQKYVEMHDLNEKLRDEVYDTENYSSIDYGRMKRAGYNGVYYGPGLWRKRELTKLCMPGDGELRNYIRWLESDTLAIWKWCF